jgi:signal transduction histidine kinase
MTAQRSTACTAELEIILAAMADAVGIYDAEGHLTYANPVLQQLLGLDADLAYAVLAPEQRARHLQLRRPNGQAVPPEENGVSQLLRGEVQTSANPWEVLLTTLDGREVALSITGAPLRGADGHITGAVATIRDMTEQRRVEHELEEQARQLEATFEAMDDGVVLYDVQGRMVRVNTAARRVFGLDAVSGFTQQAMEERAALAWPRDTHGVPLPYDRLPPVRVLRGEQLQGAEAVELLVRLPDGRDTHVLVTGAPLRDAAGALTSAVVTYHDLTEHKRLEQELAERAGLLETTFEALADGLAVFDTEGRLLRTNQAFRTLHALGEDTDFITLPAEERARLVRSRYPDGRLLTPDERIFTRIIRGEMGPASVPMDVVITNLAGREVMLNVSGAPIRDATGRVVGGVALFRDVTERRRLERERQELLGLVAHDLSNPLTTVKAQTQWLRRKLAQGEILPATALDVFDKAVDRMKRLVDDLRITENLDAGHFTLELAPCDLSALCREAAEAARLSSGRSVTLVLPAEPVVATADRDRIGQVLANLLSNAHKYSPAACAVSLRLTTQETSGEPVTSGGHGCRRAARITVHDAGPGIPPEALAQLFARFYRVPGIEVQHGPGHGLGLGLYIARELIERHGGHIGVESVVGEGSTFWFTLPQSGRPQQ